MDNQMVDVVSRGSGNLRAALSILLDSHSRGVSAYIDLPKGEREEYEPTHPKSDDRGYLKVPYPRTLILLWGDNPSAVGKHEAVPFPVHLDLDATVDMVGRWLDGLKANEKPGQIDMDGSCVPEAWRVFCESWGHVHGNHYAIAGVHGMYAWYGK